MVEVFYLVPDLHLLTPSTGPLFNCAMPHIYYALDFTVAVYVVNDDHVLLVRHRGLNAWLPVGGHIDIGETPEDAALREVLEEVGLQIELVGMRSGVQFESTRSLCAPSYLDVHPIDETHSHIGMIYFARSSQRAVKLEERELSEYAWCSYNELEDLLPLHDSVRYYASQALARLANPS